MGRTSYADFACSLARSLDAVGDAWTPLVLRDLWLGVDTFDDLVDDLGISRSLLARRLATLVERGLVVKQPTGDRAGRSAYVLTEPARELVPVLAALTAWGDRWATPDGGPPLLFTHDGHPCVPTVACGTCSEPVSEQALEPVGGPGARPSRGTAVLAGRGLRSRSSPSRAGGAVDSTTM